MEADHHQAATHGERFQRRLETALEITQLVVDMDAQALEGPGRRILALFPGRIGHGDHLGQIGGAGERALGAALHDGPRHASGKALFAIFVEHPGDFFLGSRGDPLGRADPGIRVHSHVQRTVVHEAEATLGIVQLRRGHTEVEQHPVDLALQAAGRHLLAEFGEAALDDLEATVLGGQLEAGGDRQGILVEAQQASARAQLTQHFAAVAAAPEGAIQVAALRAHGKRLDGFVEQDGYMAESGCIHIKESG
ncbi:hypothetical protein D9M71_429510 [compost metagenome]